MRRGEIYWVDLDPTRGNEVNKTRPAVIVSNDGRNRQSERSGRGVVTVAPITSNVAQVLSFQVFLAADGANGLRNDSKIQTEQLRAVAPERFGKRIGALDAKERAQLDRALKMHLDLP